MCHECAESLRQELYTKRLFISVWFSKKKDETESKAKAVIVLELYVKLTAGHGKVKTAP